MQLIKESHLTPYIQEFSDFCELTVVNVLEIAMDNIEFTEKYGSALIELFTRMKCYISQAAYINFQKTLADRRELK